MESMCPLFLAVRSGNINSVKTILQNDEVDVNKQVNGSTALHEACKRGWQNIVKLLLKHKADIEVKNQYDETPLFVAVRYGSVRSVKVLLTHKAKLNIKVDGKTPLYNACDYGHKEIVKLLLKSLAEIECITYDNETPLFIATCQGHKYIVKLLISHGAEININVNGSTPLHEAITRGYTSIVKILLENNAMTEIRNKCNETPLFRAANNGFYDIVKLLINYGAEVNVRIDLPNNFNFLYSNGRTLTLNTITPLFAASSGGYTDIVKILLDKKKENNCKNIPDSVNSLFIAAICGYVEIVKLFLDYGVHVDTVDGNGMTTLLTASEIGHYEIVQLALERGANVYHRDSRGYTSILVCKKYSILKKLLLYGADGFKDVRGKNLPKDFKTLQLQRRAVLEYITEIQKMRDIKLNSNYCIYDLFFLNNNDSARLVKNDILKEMCGTVKKCKINFQHYGPELHEIYRRALEKRNLLDAAVKAIQSVPALHLPYSCYENIFIHLNDSDLKNIIKSVNNITVVEKKRKRTRTNAKACLS